MDQLSLRGLVAHGIKNIKNKKAQGDDCFQISYGFRIKMGFKDYKCCIIFLNILGCS